MRRNTNHAEQLAVLTEKANKQGEIERQKTVKIMNEEVTEQRAQ